MKIYRQINLCSYNSQRSWVNGILDKWKCIMCLINQESVIAEEISCLDLEWKLKSWLVREKNEHVE